MLHSDSARGDPHQWVKKQASMRNQQQQLIRGNLSSYRQLPCKGSPFAEFIGLNPINETSQGTKIAGRIGGKCQHERVNIKIVSARRKHPNPPTPKKTNYGRIIPGGKGYLDFAKHQSVGRLVTESWRSMTITALLKHILEKTQSEIIKSPSWFDK